MQSRKKEKKKILKRSRQQTNLEVTCTIHKDKKQNKSSHVIVRVDALSSLTLIGTHGNSGNAHATARAPASLVNSEIPTKNSLPVNSTSPPSSLAFGSAISTIAKSSSFLRIARVFSTCWEKKIKVSNYSIEITKFTFETTNNHELALGFMPMHFFLLFYV